MPTADIGESMTVVAQQLDASSSAHPEPTSTSGDGGKDGAGGARGDGEQAAQQAASRGHSACASLRGWQPTNDGDNEVCDRSSSEGNTERSHGDDVHDGMSGGACCDVYATSSTDISQRRASRAAGAQSAIGMMHGQLSMPAADHPVVMRAHRILQEMAVGNHGPRPLNREEYRQRKAAGRERQRGRMRLYRAAATVCERPIDPPACLQKRRVGWASSVGNPHRSTRRSTRSHVHVADALASAWEVRWQSGSKAAGLASAVADVDAKRTRSGGGLAAANVDADATLAHGDGDLMAVDADDEAVQTHSAATSDSDAKLPRSGGGLVAADADADATRVHGDGGLVAVDADGEAVQVRSESGLTTAEADANVTLGRGEVRQATLLQVGSADPHGLQLNDDKVARCRKAPAFALHAHEPATADELLERPIAAMNAAVVMAPRSETPDADGLPHAPPLVRCLEELLHPQWVWRVRAWERRARRCIRLARVGKWRAARNMRPPDLWVSAEASMLPSCAHFDWDLRPWTSGMPAVPTARSHRDGTQPCGSVNLAAFANIDPGFADQAIAAEVCDGIADDVAAPRGSLLCAPHTGALRFYSEARARLDVNVNEQWAVEYASLPFWPLRCDPYSVVDESERAGKPKFRLTNDHSWPPPGTIAGDGTFMGAWGDHVPSLNESMRRGEWPEERMLRVKDMAEAAAVLQRSGAQVRMGVLDIAAYYKQFGRQLGEHWRNGAITERGFLVDERCCFGSAADATKCVRVSNLLVHHVRIALRAVDARYPTRDSAVLDWLQQRAEAGREAGASEAEVAERWSCLHAVGMYVDDSAHASIDDLLFDVDGAPVLKDGVHLRRAEAHFDAMRECFHSFGLQTTKEQPPAQVVDFLGVRIDLERGRLTLTDRKRRSYARQARAMAARSTCERSEYLQLLGKLNFAATCYPRGRQWLHAPWRAARAAFRTRGDVVVIPVAAACALIRWATELVPVGTPDEGPLPQQEGVPLAARARFPESTSEDALCIYADAARDASDTCGWCAWAVAGKKLLYAEGQWTKEEREALLICDLELAASTFGLVAFQPLVGRRHVYSFTDNVVAQAAMRGLVPSTPAMQRLTAERVTWLLQHGVTEASARITSAANLWADLGSRGKIGDVLAQARALGLTPHRVSPPATWMSAVAEEAHHARVGMGASPPPSVTPPSPEPPPAPRRDVEGSNGGASSTESSSADERERVGSAAQTIPECGDGGSNWRGTNDRCAVVDQVLRLRAEHVPLHSLRQGCHAAGDGRGRAAADGLLSMACYGEALRQEHQREDDWQVRQSNSGMAPAGVQDAHMRRPRLKAAQRSTAWRMPFGGTTAEAATLGGTHAGLVSGGPAFPSLLAPRGCDVGSSAAVGLLRIAARRGVCFAGRRELQPGGEPEQGGPQVPDGERRRGVCDHHDPRSQGQAGRGQGDAPHLRRRGDYARCGEGAQGNGSNRPRRTAAGGDYAVVPTGVRSSHHGTRGTCDGEGADGHARARRAPLRRAFNAHRRRVGCAGGGRPSVSDPCGGSLGIGYLRDLHALQS